MGIVEFVIGLAKGRTRGSRSRYALARCGRPYERFAFSVVGEVGVKFEVKRSS